MSKKTWEAIDGNPNNTGYKKMESKDYTAQVQEWKRDAERYRWLKKQFRIMSLNMGGNHSWVLQRPLRDGRTIDEVCDKSMEQQT